VTRLRRPVVMVVALLLLAACDPQTAEDLRNTTTTASTTTSTLAPTTTTTSTSTTTTSVPRTTTTTEPPTTTSTTVPRTTTTTVAPTTTVDFWYAVSEPTYYPPPQPGAGPYLGSGCSPGTSHLPDGIWFGRLVDARPSRSSFDLMCFAPSPPGHDGVAVISNTNPLLRTVPVERGATVFAIAVDGGWTLMPYDAWYEEPPSYGFCPPEGCWLVWLYVNNGAVTEIVQLWFA
jgi:hypothetical protein